MTEIANGTEIYQTTKEVALSKCYQLYLCKQERTGRQCLLQIASAVEHNGGLQRTAFTLNELKARAEDLEKEYEKVKKDPNVLLNYGLGFPELVDSFICQEQGGRWINILAFRNVNEISRMVPLSNITDRDRQRIDPRTSTWIMGKLLKMLAFAHGQRISDGLLTKENILIEPKEHYVVIFDWLSSRMHSEAIPEEVRHTEISEAAKVVIATLGGDLETGIFPDDGEEISVPYTDFLLELARGKMNNAQGAHDEFYKLVDSLWRREYYPITSKRRND